tara:strand:+ start:229 stop:513 length:285 start_codon:yes stop_codon:yes gene_type:complete
MIKDPKVGTGKKPKGSGRRLYTDENPKDTVGIKFAPLRMLVGLWQKLNESANHTQEKSKYLQSVNKEPKLWVRRRWQAYLRKVRKQLEKGEKHE